jgi:hypothetical protein
MYVVFMYMNHVLGLMAPCAAVTDLLHGSSVIVFLLPQCRTVNLCLFFVATVENCKPMFGFLLPQWRTVNLCLFFVATV